MDSESNDIKVPIKDIVENSVRDNGADYDVEFINLLRRYFIACLNLGYIELEDLSTMVNKFTDKIKRIHNDYNFINKLDNYIVKNTSLFINGELFEISEEKYIINFFKAVTEIIFASNDEHIGFSNAICEMTSEKLYNMDINNDRIILPKTVVELINNEKIQIRAGYKNYNLIISLLKQLFISRNCNENILIRDMFYKGYDEVFFDFTFDEINSFLIHVLDEICIMYIRRLILNETNFNEKNLIDKYQLLLNQLFSEKTETYFAFCALITSDTLREQCMKA